MRTFEFQTPNAGVEPGVFVRLRQFPNCFGGAAQDSGNFGGGEGL